MPLTILYRYIKFIYVCNYIEYIINKIYFFILSLFLEAKDYTLKTLVFHISEMRTIFYCNPSRRDLLN